MTNKSLIDVAKIQSQTPEQHKRGLVHHMCEYLALEKRVPRDEDEALQLYRARHEHMNYICGYSSALQLNRDNTHRLYAQKILETYDKLKEASRTKRINETPTETHSSGNRPVLYGGRSEEWWREEFMDMGSLKEE